MHLGVEGCKSLDRISAEYNQIRYVSSRISDCHNLTSLRLSHNNLMGLEFLPSEFLDSANIQNNL